MIGRRRRRAGAGRHGADGGSVAAGWGNPADHELAAEPLVDRAMLGRGWHEQPMINNEPQRRPFTDDPAAAGVEAARQARRPTGLHEGTAWRHRDTESLLVIRVDVYADADDTAHRAAWVADGVACLDATWRARWRERGITPGWVEARPVPPAERVRDLHVMGEARPTGVAAAVDWYRVEDHTDPTDERRVTSYEHLTVWNGRRQATLTFRHPLGIDLDDLAADVAVAVHNRLTHPT